MGFSTFIVLFICFGEIIFTALILLIILIRIFLPIFIKKNTKVLFLNDELTVSGKRIKKEIQYFDIKKLVIKKNVLGSYDIIIKPDVAKCAARYYN